MRGSGCVVMGYALALAACFNVKANFLPKDVTQEIGANHLAASQARWECDPDEDVV